MIIMIFEKITKFESLMIIISIIKSALTFIDKYLKVYPYKID